MKKTILPLKNEMLRPIYARISKVKQSKRRNAQKEGDKVVEIKRVYKVKENAKKLLTKRGESGRIVKLSQRAEARRKISNLDP